MASLSDLMKAKATAMASTAPQVAAMNVIDNPVPAYSGEEIMITSEPAAYPGVETYAEERFVRSNKYLWYEEYKDDAISYIDKSKNITVDDSQINVTQEENSQFVKFELDRYYDGIDLTNMIFRFHFVNKNNDDAEDPVCNFEYSENKIRFAWKLSKNATAVSGLVRFEIIAEGVNERGESYTWKTTPSGKFNIIESLSGSGRIQPSTDWLTSFLIQVTEQVAEAQNAAKQALNAAEQAESSANLALQAAADSQVTINEAKEELSAFVDESVENAVTTALLNYYNKKEVDDLIANVDVTEQMNEVRGEITKLDEKIQGQITTIQKDIDDVKLQIENMDGLANFNVEYDGKKMTFYNGEAVMKEIEINSDPSQEWTTSYTASIDQKIATAKQESQDALNEYAETVDADLSSIHDAIDGLPETLASDYYTKTDSDDKFATKTDLTSLNQTISGINSSIETNKSNIETVSGTLVDLQEEVASIDKSPRVTYDFDYNNLEDPNGGENKFVVYKVENEGLETETRELQEVFTIQGGSGGGGGSVLKIEYVTTSPIVATINDKVEIKFNFSGTDSSGDQITDGQATWKVGSTIVAAGLVTAGENSFDITDYLAIGTQKVLLSITDDNGSLTTKTWTVQKLDVKIETDFNDKLTYPLGTVALSYTPYGAISKDVHFKLDGKEIGTVTTSASGIPMGYTLPSQTHGAHLLEVYMTATINNNPIESNHIVKDIIWYDETSKVPVIGCTQTKITALQYDTTNIVYTVYDPSTESPKVTLAVDGNVVSNLTLEKNTDTWQFKSTEVGNHVLTITCGETVKTINVTVEKLDITVEPVTAGLVIDFNPVGKSNSDSDRIWSNDTYKMSVSDNFDWVNGGYQIDSKGDQYFCIKAGTNIELDYQMFADDAKRTGKEMKLIFKTTNVQQANAQFMTCVDNTTGSDHIGIEMFVHEAFIYGGADKLNLKYSENDIIEFEFNITNNQEAVTEICGYEDGVATRHLVYDDTFNFTQTTPKVIKLGSDRCDVHIYRMKIYNTSLTDRGILSNFIADARSAEEMINRYNRNQIYDENSQLTPEVLAEKCPWLRVYIVSAPYFTNKKSDKVPYTTIKQIYKGGDPVLDNWTCYYAQHSGQGTSSDNYGASARNLDFIMNKEDDDGNIPYFILGDGKTRTDKVSLTRTSIPNAYFNFKANVASSNHFTNALLAKRYNEFNPYILQYVREDESIIDHIKTTMEFHNAVVFIQETNDDYSTHREFADKDIHFYSIGNIGDSKKTDKSRLVDPSDRYEFINEICDVELPLSDWPNTPEAIAALEAEQFDKSGSYEWRYIWDKGTDEENEEVFNYCKQKWIEMYKFVVQSSDEEFKANFDKYFVKDSLLYYYLFTTRYCMVDNRAKNLFIGYAKTGELDAEGQPIRKFHVAYGYDMDSSMSLNNYGNSVYRHGYEDTDNMDGTSEEVFRESDSTLWCRIRDNFEDDLKQMYNTLESKNAWHSESFLNEIEAWQKQFPEELWRLDCQRKYIRTVNSSFISDAGDPQYLKNMAQGRMLYAVKQWERSQEAYMASKYQSTTASADNIVLRCTVPTGDLVVPANYGLKLTPYDYMYLNVKYGNTSVPIQVRAYPGIQYEIPYEGTVDILDIYSASRLQDLGDLSSTYPATVDTAKATRLKELHVGNSTEGYDNPNFTSITLGANYLLEVLNLENISGLTQSLNLSALNNLKELYAHGTNTGGVTFASGGAIQIAELPAIGAMSAKNLAYLETIDISSYNNLTTLTVENCSTIDVINIFELASNLNRVRITGVDWTLTDDSLLDRIYKMAGIDLNGYNTAQSVLSGKVHIPNIHEQKLYDYQRAWPDLEITGKVIPQFIVTFVNEDGAILDKQYVVKGESAVDPITRENDPIETPKKESTISHDFTFDKWDGSFTNVFSDRTITATYTSSLRSYTIKYISKGTVMQETTDLYGSYVPYSGVYPTYTREESGYIYYWFDRWDKSGLIDGDKVVEAIFDECVYTENYFNGKELKDLRPVEIYAMTKLGLEQSVITDMDDFSFTVGHDVNYDDVESIEVISEKMNFNGTNHYDTQIPLFDEDKDFVVAIDYEFLTGTNTSGVLAQCFQANGSNGFKLWFNSGVRLTWGTSTSNIAAINKREMVILRHKKGDPNLYIYNSNLDSTAISMGTLEKTKDTIGTGTLVFGSAKADDGAYENYAVGNIHWCKVWYADLGEEMCKKLALWTHEKIAMQACGFRKYYLSENASKRCSFSLLAKHLLSKPRKFSDSQNNTGGWASSTLRTFLNGRFYQAIPDQIRGLLKQVNIPSSIGDKSIEISESACYVAIPALIEMCPTMTSDPYLNEGTAISYMTSNDARKRAYDGGNIASYWLRSPNASHTTYIYTIDTSGKEYGFVYPNASTNTPGVLIELSI